MKKQGPWIRKTNKILCSLHISANKEDIITCEA